MSRAAASRGCSVCARARCASVRAAAPGSFVSAFACWEGACALPAAPRPPGTLGSVVLGSASAARADVVLSPVGDSCDQAAAAPCSRSAEQGPESAKGGTAGEPSALRSCCEPRIAPPRTDPATDLNFLCRYFCLFSARPWGREESSSIALHLIFFLRQGFLLYLFVSTSQKWDCRQLPTHPILMWSPASELRSSGFAASGLPTEVSSSPFSSLVISDLACPFNHDFLAWHLQDEFSLWSVSDF